MSIVIKICGFRDSVNAIVAARAGADLLGFIFAPSRRQVTAAEVASIMRDVRAAGFTTPAVGVFVDPDPVQLRSDIEISGIDYVQLSGDESPEILAQISLPVIKVLPAGNDDDLDTMLALTESWRGARHIMLDASIPGVRGGTGKRANWELAHALTQHIPVVLAGGLDPDNVAEAIAAVDPFGLDLSTGVETDGVKDPEKIERFIANARKAFADSPSSTII